MDMRGLKRRWMAAGSALAIALAGVALAFGETGGQEEKPADWVRQLSDPDWRVRARAMESLREGGEDSFKALFSEQNPHPEARFRIALLKKELAPVHGSWSNALEAGRAALDQGRWSRALELLLVAARKNEHLRTDPWIAALCERAWNAVPETSRRKDGMLDWQMYLVGEHCLLADRYPSSPLREKSLFLAGRYQDVAREFPKGTYAPLARYSIVAGHPYYQPQKYLEIKDPAGEAESWERFLREFPGHPGSDDAAYRLGRAMELLGRNREAVIWLSRSASMPDGEFAWKGPMRALYVMDALATEEELEQLRGKSQPSTLREKASLTLAVRSLRNDRFDEAVKRFRVFSSEFPSSRWRATADRVAGELAESVVPRSARVIAGPPRDDDLYEIGRYFYHRLLALYNPAWDNGRVKYFGYEITCLGRSHAFGATEYFEKHNNFLKAAEYFDRLWRELPNSPRRPAALYSAGTAYLRAATLDRFSVYGRTREQMLDESADRYRRLAAEHPGDALAPAALKMIETVKAVPREQ